MEVLRLAGVVTLLLISVSSSNADPTPPSGGAAGGGNAHSLPCIQKLMPCQPYLHSVTPPPPPSCCVPLNEIVKTDLPCLCSVFNNVDMLKSLNLTKENAMVLPKACGAKADVSDCKNSAGTTTPSSTPPAATKTPPASSTGSNSTGGSATSTAKPTTSAAPAIYVAKLSFVSAVATLFFYVFIR